MPVIEQHPLSRDRSPFKDDRLPPPRRPSISEHPRPIVEQPKLCPDVEKYQPKMTHFENETKDLKTKYKPPPHQDQPPRRSEYDNVDDDREPLIAIETLCQLLELDEDEKREFSKEMVEDYFKQAEDKFDEMDREFSSRSLSKLSSSGHFLKGSSAAIGLSRVQSTCEKIQHCGAKRDENLDIELSDKEALDIMDRLLKKVRLQYKEAKKWLDDFFANNRALPEEDVYSV